MRVIRDLQDIPGQCKGAALALGNFDGVHRGHQSILSACVQRARAENCPAAVMTFEPHPREFFANLKLRSGPNKNDISVIAPLRIFPLRRKLELLREHGIDIVYLLRFNRELASTSAADFITNILVGKLAVRHVVTGDNFAFGASRQGNAALLAKAKDFVFSAVSPFKDDDIVISSTAIRETLAQGDMHKASHMLGHPYQISGHVKHGDQRGRDLGFPTANLSLGTLFTPRFGIYAARVQLSDGWHDAAVNLGVNPTFPQAQPSLEAHIFDMNRNLYGQYMRVELIQFLRDEAIFSDMDGLRAQIARDCDQIRTILSQKKVSSCA